MSAPKDGGSAYPFTSGTNKRDNCTQYEGHPGMSLRDYFAAKAMQGALAAGEPVVFMDRFGEWCYEIADAMLRVRQPQGGE